MVVNDSFALYRGLRLTLGRNRCARRNAVARSCGGSSILLTRSEGRLRIRYCWDKGYKIRRYYGRG